MTKQRVRLLYIIGFKWILKGIPDAAWMKKYNDLKSSIYVKGTVIFLMDSVKISVLVNGLTNKDVIIRIQKKSKNKYYWAKNTIIGGYKIHVDCRWFCLDNEI